MKNITSTIELEEHCGSFYPKDAWAFGRAIESNQENNLKNIISVLFNKGRYFETTVPNRIIKEISELIQSPIQYDTMIVDSWKKLEDFVIAMNCLDYYVKINIDFI
jgi:hypothetical protein